MNENDNNQNNVINLSKDNYYGAPGENTPPDTSREFYPGGSSSEYYPGGNTPAGNSQNTYYGNAPTDTNPSGIMGGPVYGNFGRHDDLKSSGSVPSYPDPSAASDESMSGSYRQSYDPNVTQGYTAGTPYQTQPVQQPQQTYQSQPYASQQYQQPQQQSQPQFSTAFQQPPAAFSQGYQQPDARYYNGQDPYAGFNTAPDTKLATASLVLGIISVAGWFLGFLFPPLFVCPIVGLILGIVHKNKHIPAGKGTSTAGIILSAIGIVLPILIIVLLVAMMPQLLKYVQETDPETYQQFYDQYGDQLPNWFSVLISSVKR